MQPECQSEHYNTDVGWDGLFRRADVGLGMDSVCGADVGWDGLGPRAEVGGWVGAQCRGIAKVGFGRKPGFGPRARLSALGFLPS